MYKTSYIKNKTLCISLLLFDLCLRRESYHNYNRFYLLFTFLLGALLPMWQWQNDSELYPKAMQQPVERVLSAKENIVTAGTPSAALDWQQWLALVYLGGALVALCLLIIDIVKLAAYYRGGTRSRQDNWTIIEIGKDHAPFSFMNTLFVSSVAVYDADEWHMILTHERRHTTLRHFADLLLMQLARVAFWFHPLVYMYNKRLLLVHEYQADNASAQKPQVYGKFLVEQALLQTAPALSHSFNRSPIKKRIIMLTRRSTTAAKTKMLVFVPLAVVCIVCFSKNGFSQKFEKNGNTVTYKGNKFELSGPLADTISLTDPVTGKEKTMITKRDPVPVSMNGVTVQTKVDKPAYFKESETNLRAYLLKHLKKELENLKDGNYSLNISDVVVDEHGKVVYFKYADMRRSKDRSEMNMPAGTVASRQKLPSNEIHTDGSGQMKITMGNDAPTEMKGKSFLVKKNDDPGFYEDIDNDVQQQIFRKVCKLLDKGALYLPATLDGNKVISTDQNSILFWNTFKVKDHKVYDMKLGQPTEL